MSSFAPTPSSSARIVRPVPPQHPGMTVLDKTVFDVKLTTLATSIPAAKTGALRQLPILKGQLLELAKTATIRPDPTHPNDRRLVLLASPDKNDLPDGAIEAMAALVGEPTLDLTPFELTLNYDFWSSADLIDAILPAELKEGAPGGFTLTGHLAHMNLRDEYLPYKKAIGQIVMDKNAGLRTVVNKLDSIDTEFRFFKMEVLAGEEDFLVNLHESGCKFTFDFSTVYWNSRLSYEHDRLIGQFIPGQLVADVFAGVGPFAVPAAKKKCFVMGNDLNPSSTKWMEKNRVQNKVEKTLAVTTLDGRQFIRDAALSAYLHPFAPLAAPPPKRVKTSKGLTPGSASTPPAPIAKPISPPRFIDHFVMNLPGSALDDFLDAFIGCYQGLARSKEDGGAGLEGDALDEVTMPMVHVHCFTKFEDAEAERDIAERASKSLSHPISRASTPDFSLKEVRRVAPNKLMYCLSFRLPREVAFADAPAS